MSTGMFTGKDSHIVNTVADTILKLGSQEIDRHRGDPDYTPSLVAYIGSRQVAALARIGAEDRHAVKNGSFLGAKLIMVREDDYLHVVPA